MPTEVPDAIRRARAAIGGTIEDEDYRRRLQDRFGDKRTMAYGSKGMRAGLIMK